MFQHLIVPIDGSSASWDVVPIAARMAAAVDGKVDVVTVVDRLADIAPAERELEQGMERFGALATDVQTQVLASDSVADALTRHVEAIAGATVAMSSHGHGRSAAVLGSTADEVLRRIYGPIVVVGAHVRDGVGELSGTYVVPVDGSANGELIVPIAEAWAIEFNAVPWLVEVLEPGSVPREAIGDVFESAYAARLAQGMQRDTGREIEYEVLHGKRPATAIVDFADQLGASLIFATTHGRSGMQRLRAGSVVADIIRHAHCPVVLHRPPHFSE